MVWEKGPGRLCGPPTPHVPQRELGEGLHLPDPTPTHSTPPPTSLRAQGTQAGSVPRLSLLQSRHQSHVNGLPNQNKTLFVPATCCVSAGRTRFSRALRGAFG